MKNLLFIFLITAIWSCAPNRKIVDETVTFTTMPEKINTTLQIKFEKGKQYNHPSFAIWVEDLEGKYIETLYVTQFVATGKFGHGEIEPGKWKDESGEVRRPASLPYWSHKRNIQAPDGLFIPSSETAIPDALTGATPKTDYTLNTGTVVGKNQKFRVLLEINQAWDSNEYWTNNKFPENRDYFTSLQPAVVYAVTVDPTSTGKQFFLNPVGHSEPSGKTGDLFTDVTTLTTALEIVGKISVEIK